MSYTIVADVCEGTNDCIPACPVHCIHQGEGRNAKDKSFVVIDAGACIDCGFCLTACPTEGAVLAEWRPELQTPQTRPAATLGETRPAAIPGNQSAPLQDAAEALAHAMQLQATGDTAGAATAYTLAIDLNEPEVSAEAAHRLGSQLEDRGEYDAALAAYQRGLEFSDSVYQQRCALDAAAVLYNPKGDLAAAAEMCRRAMDSRHSDNAAAAACNLGIVLAAQGDVWGAVWAYRGAIGCAHPQQSSKAALALGKLLEEQGDASGAAVAYRQVLDFDDEERAIEARNLLQRLSTPTQESPTGLQAAVMRWATTHLVKGSDRNYAHFADRISRLKSESCEVMLKVSAEQSKSDTPLYGITWLDEFHAFKLSPRQAYGLGIEPDTITMQGIGGGPRADTRQFPLDVHLERLSINDGKDVTSDISITVAVRCEASGLLPEDMRLRVGYVADEMKQVFSPPISGEIPPHGLLKKRLEPLAEDGWLEGPVPIFVDLVVTHGEVGSDHLHFTVISNTLTALVDVTRPQVSPTGKPGKQPQQLRTGPAQDPQLAVRQAILEWAAANWVQELDDRLAANFADGIRDLQSNSSVLKLLLSADRSKTGHAIYGISWIDELHSFELSEEQARQLGIESDQFRFYGLDGGRNETRVLPPDVHIEGLQINDGAPISGDVSFNVVVSCDSGGRRPPGLRLRVGYVLGHVNLVLSPEPADISQDGTVLMTMDPLTLGGWFEGPMMVFAEFVASEGVSPNGQFKVVSNTMTALVDVARTSRTVQPGELRAAAEPWCELIIGGERERAQALANALVPILQANKHFAMMLPAGLTPDSTAFFALSCPGGLFALPITASQAAAAGVESGGARLTATMDMDDGGRPHIIRLRGLSLGGDFTPSRSGPDEAMGVFWIECAEALPTDLILRKTFTFAGSTRVSAEPTEVATDSAWILTFPNPQEQPRPGPVLVAFDFCVPDGTRLASVSNTVVGLYNVRGYDPTAVRTLTPQTATAPALRPSPLSASGATQRKPPSAADFRDLHDERAVREAIAKYVDFAKDVLAEGSPYDPEKGRQMRQCVESIAVIAGKHQTAYVGLDELGELLADRGYTSEAQAAHMIARKSGLAEVMSRASYRLGDMARRFGDTDLARRFFDEVLASGNQAWVPHAAMRLAEINTATGHYRELEQNLQIVVDSGNRYLAPIAAYNLGVVRKDHLGDPAGADAAYQIGIDSGDPEWRAACAKGQGDLRDSQGDYSGAERAYETAISANHPKWSARAAFNLGVTRLQHGDSAGGIAANEIALASGDPEVAPLAARQLGIAKENAGDFAGAERAYLSGMKSGNTEVSACCAGNLGTLYAKRQDYERACDAFRFAMASGDPNESPRAAFNLAVAEDLQGNTAAAERACQIAIESQHPEFALRASELLKDLGSPK